MSNTHKALLEKIGGSHLVADLGEGASLIYIDRAFFHDRTSSISLQSLGEEDRELRQANPAFTPNPPAYQHSRYYSAATILAAALPASMKIQYVEQA